VITLRPPARLHRVLPLDRQRVLHVGSGPAPELTRYPWLRVGEARSPLEHLSFDDSEFDCVYAPSGVDRSSDEVLSEFNRVLAPGGCLVTRRRSALGTRLGATGFAEVSEPQPGAYVAWKQPRDRVQRARELTHWAHMSLDPGRPQNSDDPLRILADGYALCWGYVLVLGEALRRENYRPRYVTMVAEEHPRGRGERLEDSHDVLEVPIDRVTVVCDPMANVVFTTSIAELLAEPGRADVPRDETERYRARRYDLYSTSVWYERVRRVAVRRDRGSRLRFQSVVALVRGTATS